MVDIDNDGDLDVLGTTGWGNALAWFENVGFDSSLVKAELQCRLLEYESTATGWHRDETDM